MRKTINLTFTFDKKQYADAFSLSIALPGLIDPSVHLELTYEFVDVLEILEHTTNIKNAICKDVLKIIADYCAPLDLLKEDEFCYELDCFSIGVSNEIPAILSPNMQYEMCLHVYVLDGEITLNRSCFQIDFEYFYILGKRVLHINQHKITVIGTGPMNHMMETTQQLVSVSKLHVSIDNKFIFNASENSAKLLVM